MGKEVGGGLRSKGADCAGNDDAVEHGVELPVAETAYRLVEVLLQAWTDRLDVLHAWRELDDAVVVLRRDHAAINEAGADERGRLRGVERRPAGGHIGRRAGGWRGIQATSRARGANCADVRRCRRVGRR